MVLTMVASYSLSILLNLINIIKKFFKKIKIINDKNIAENISIHL